MRPARRCTCSRARAPASGDAACGIEAIGGLRKQVVDVALQDGLQQMWLAAASDDHFGTNPERVTWGDVGSLGFVTERLKEITEFLGV
jgi:hypothetical protein